MTESLAEPMFSIKYSAGSSVELEALRADAIEHIKTAYPTDMFLRTFTMGENTNTWLERLDVFAFAPHMPQGVPSCTLTTVGEA